MAFPFYGADGTSGTVAATNGSKTVVGTGTNWLSNNAIPSAGGYCIKMPDEQIYGIDTCTGEGALSLTENYNGSTVSGGSYYIIPTAASNAALLNQVSTLLTSSNFSQIAGLSPNSGDFPEYLSGTWTTRSPTQVLLNLLNSMGEVSIASASTCDIGAATTPKVQITGTTTITGFGSQASAVRFVRFGGALTLTQNATSLILLGGADRVTASGDTGIYVSDSSGHWREWAYFKADGTVAVREAVSTRTVLTSGSSATYTTPSGVRQLRVRLKGGGGGGGGTGTASATGGGTGGTTIFNSINANGGTGGSSNATGTGGAGGVGGSGTGTSIKRIAGATGGPTGTGIFTSTNFISIGGFGGGKGGGNAIGSANAGVAGAANTGGGGSGGGIGSSSQSTLASFSFAGGGGEGEEVEFIINSPSSSYTYTVGAGGTAGSAGTSGFAGGAGGSGYIIVDEIY
jgi:hypothetical protein